MVNFLYTLFASLSRLVGPWIFSAAGLIISTGFFLCARRRVAVSLYFYQNLFPGKGWLFYNLCALKQFNNFSKVHIERMLFQDLKKLTYSSDGWERIVEVLKNGKGAIILTSHMGNWEAAAHFFKDRGLDLMLYMGSREKEQLEKMQKKGLIQSGITISTVGQDMDSPFGLLDGINFLKKGGIVAMAGDRIWRSDQRVVTVSFLGHEVILPETPHYFALLSGAPILYFFAFRNGKISYHFTASEPVYVKASARAERSKAVQDSVNAYAGALEKQVCEHPFEWYHFDPFLGKKLS